MEIRTYPYNGWVLNQLNVPKRVRFGGAGGVPGITDVSDVTLAGKHYHLSAIFPTKAAAQAKADSLAKK